MSDTKQLEALREEQAAGVGAATTIWPTDDPRIDVMTAQLAACDRAIARLRAEQPQPQPSERSAPKPVARITSVGGSGGTVEWVPAGSDEVAIGVNLALYADLVAALAEVERLKAKLEAMQRFRDRLKSQLAAAQREPDARWSVCLLARGDAFDVRDQNGEQVIKGSYLVDYPEFVRLLAGRDRVTLRVYAEEEQP